MICKNCGKFNPEGTVTCVGCGQPMNGDTSGYTAPAYTEQPPYAPYQPRHAAPAVPPEYRPLSPWAYFGYQLLFAIPVVGFIMLIVFSCGGTSNINLKNYARSYWCGLIISLIVIVIAVILIASFGGLSALERGYY